MRWIAGLCAALLIGSSCSPAETSPAQPRGIQSPPNLSAIYPRSAVDHVVTYSWWRGFGPKGGDRVTLWRHASLVREERNLIGSKRPVDPARQVGYSNIATLASFQGELRGPREYSGFTIWLPSLTSGRFELVPTGERQVIAGEQCSVWRAIPLSQFGVARRGCITADGVVLYEAWLYSSGTVAEERIALNVARRKVAPAEVLPPKAALSWSYWKARAAGLRANSTGKPSNYEVRLKSEPGTAELRYRASGGWNSMEGWASGKLERLHFSHASRALNLSHEKSSLSISSRPDRQQAQAIGRVEAMDRKPQTILGEQCSWFNTTVGVHDYSRVECRTQDGLALIIEEGGRGGGRPAHRAVLVSRGKTSERDLVPPARLLNWARWGWPELGR